MVRTSLTVSRNSTLTITNSPGQAVDITTVLYFTDAPTIHYFSNVYIYSFVVLSKNAMLKNTNAMKNSEEEEEEEENVVVSRNIF